MFYKQVKKLIKSKEPGNRKTAKLFSTGGGGSKGIKFKEWLESNYPKKMKKIARKEVTPKNVRNLEDDLSKDYKGHIAKNGDVEPWKCLGKK